MKLSTKLCALAAAFCGVSSAAASAVEANFAFRTRLLDVHPERLVADDAAPVGADETQVGSAWTVRPAAGDAVLLHAAKDFRDYLGKWKCRNTERCDGGRVEERKGGVVEIGVDPSLPQLQAKIDVGERRIRVTGATSREAYQGCIRLEDEMNVRGRPAVKRGERTYTRLFSPRMTHSGYALETFTDEYLD